MVNDKIKLGTIVLFIKSINESWGSITLQHIGEFIKLGEEDRAIFLNKLVTLFTEGIGDIVGCIEDVDVCWVASLSEGHHSIYAGVNDDLIWLFIESPDGKIICKTKLDKEEVDIALTNIRALI